MRFLSEKSPVQIMEGVAALPAFLGGGPGVINLRLVPAKALKMINLLFMTLKAPVEVCIACQLAATAFFAGKTSVSFGGQSDFASHYALICGKSGINKSAEVITDLNSKSPLSLLFWGAFFFSLAKSLSCCFGFYWELLLHKVINAAEARVREARGIPRCLMPKVVGGELALGAA
jgi:hypothetical protein